MCEFTAIFIYIRIACLMHSLNIVKPLRYVVFLFIVIKNTNLAHIFQNNFLSFSCFIAWIDSTIFSSTETILLEVRLITVYTFPENVMRSESQVLSYTLIEVLKIFNKVNGSIWTWSQPDIVFDIVSSNCR